MKTIFILCGLTVAMGSVLIWNALRWPNEYGTFTGAPHADIAVLVEKPQDFLAKTLSVAGTVQQQCKTMGCFFYIHEGRKTLRVDLEGIAMKAPRREGHPVRVEGRLVAYGDGYQLFASAVKFE